MVLTLFLLLVPMVMPLSAESVKRVESTGYGVIVKGDRVAAYEEAKQNALRQAVEEGVGVLLSSHARVENFALIEDNIYTKTEGYVRTYDVLDEQLIDESTLAVTLASTVELGALQDRIEGLEVLVESAGNPYILVLESDKEGGRVGSHLRGALGKISKRLNLMIAPEISPIKSTAEAAEIGQKMGADIVVFAHLENSLQGDKPIPFTDRSLGAIGIYSAAANIRLEGLWSDTGRVFSTHHGSARAAAGQAEAALEKARAQCARSVADSLVGDLVENWRNKVYSGRLVRMIANFEGVDPQEFESALVGALGSVQTLHKRVYDADRAVFDIQSKNTGFDIARHLTLKVEDQFEMTIQQSTLNSITVSVGRAL